jgi:hypothetical protein
MNYRVRILLFSIFLFCYPLLWNGAEVLGQYNQRSKKIFFSTDTTRLDTLSIIPGTIKLIKKNGEAVDSSIYKIDYVNALLILRQLESKNKKDSFVVVYHVFPYFFSKPYQHKDIRRIQNNQYGDSYVYTLDKNREVDFFKTEGLTKSGSLSRGISFGNNQDVALNSNLNLQLAGKLSDNMDILLAATDQNIPIQPEGNTQQLQEFDKIFIRIGIKDLPVKGKTTVTAGDFQVEKPGGYFMNFNKKLQGLSFKSEIGSEKAEVIQTTASAAVSKGKFAKNSSIENSNGNFFNGQKQERNQGPYKFRGAENEQYIIVLAGTERVYLEGQLLERGQENDYVIDYNTAEIIFTPKNLITKDNRITVEFQYSDKNYARSLIHAGTEYENRKVKARVNIFSEQDNKNKPLQQELSGRQKLLLSSIGDTLQNALWPVADSVAFNRVEILYEKKDSSLYKKIYVYSTDSAKAHYRLSFSFVGINKGNYRIKQSSANGKVYEWVKPDIITGQQQGAYEPIILLRSPKQKQMITAGATIMLSKNATFSIEGAGSNYNINSFSKEDKANDKGFAGKLIWDNKIPLNHLSSALPSGENVGVSGEKILNGIWSFFTNINYEYVQKNFSSIERFRNVEFERDWNRGNTLQTGDQHTIGGKIGFAKKNNIITYDYKSLLDGNVYHGMRHSANVNIGVKGFLLTADGSYLDSKSLQSNSNFLRHHASLSREFKIQNLKFKTGIREQQEENLFKLKNTSSLLNGSSQFMEWEPFVELRDSSNNKYILNYKQRIDYALNTLGTSELHPSTYAESYGGGMELMSNPNSQLRITGNYRNLKILDAGITTQKPENTVVSRTEYNFSLLKGFFSSTTFYEIGSGLEVKKEFVFLEVAVGQGTYLWNSLTDYNANGIKELNEFEIALPNEGNYIKVFIPTDNYISTHTNQFGQMLSMKPDTRWNNKKGVRKIASYFMNQTAYRTDRKTTNKDLTIAYNPFLSNTKDSTLVTLNSSLRNTLYFNQTDAVFGMDFTWQQVQSKTLLVNDTAFRTHTTKEAKVHWNFNRQWTFQNAYKNGIKQNNSKFFNTRNYKIYYFETEPKISFQSNSSLRITVSYKYSEKENRIFIGANTQAKATVQNIGSELQYNALNKGSLSMKANFIHIFYNDLENLPIAYEMLEGLKTGKNYTWALSYNRILANNIQLTLTYDGRQSPGIKTIHTGNAQVRAFF